MQSRFGAPGLATRYLITQNNFNAWAESVKPRTRALTAFFLMLVAVACSAAIIVMAPRLARESALLWFGKHAEGVIKSADVIEVGKFKGGDPPHQRILLQTTICAPTSMRCCCSCRGSRFSASWDRYSTCTDGGSGAAHQAR